MFKTVYLPQCCARSAPGILLGTTNDDNTNLYIVAVVHFPITPKNLNAYIAKHHKNKNDNQLYVDLKPVGTWTPYDSSEKIDKDFHKIVPKLFGQTTWISIQGKRSDNGEVSFFAECLQIGSNIANDIFHGNTFVAKETGFMLVWYNQKEIWDGEFSDEALFKTDLSEGSIEELFAVVQGCRSGILSYESGLNPGDGVSVTHCCIEREISLTFFLITVLVTFVIESLSKVFGAMENLCSNFPDSLSTILRWVGKCTKVSSFCTHTKRRTTDFIKSVVTLFDGQSNGKENYQCHDVITSIFIDIIFGLVFLSVLRYHGLLHINGTTKDVFLPYVDTIAKQVEELIKWLMGIPAGLKLNHPLNQFLGHFFLYHVRLWLEYAKMMMDLFPELITYCLMSSCMGLSFLLAVISDAISTLSFHVYCFYVYAGRLYGLQISGLMSLWRLFRGKKWNPLRKRVDSLEESGQRADQLFAGTLFFTVLLFLLPTVALYYGIFVLLRVAVLAMQVVLGSLIFLLSEFPWYSLFVRLRRPHKFIKSSKITWLSPVFKPLDETVQHRVVEHGPNEAIAIQMRTDPKPVFGVLKTAMNSRKEPSVHSSGFRTLLKKIVVGDLIRWS